MKKVLGILLAIALVCGVCVAEGMDYASMSDEQLHAVIDAARNELAKRELTAAENTVLFEQDGVSVYLTSGFEASSFTTDDMRFMNADVVVVNDSDKAVSVSIDSMSVNGWEVGGLGFFDIPSGKKKMDELSFNAANTDVSSVDELETLEISFHLFDPETFSTFADVPPVTLHFNVQ